MKEIAVFCALPPERNTGMATVDLAASRVLRRLFPQASVTLYAYGKAGPYAYQHGELPYIHLDVNDHRERFLAADAIVYWGDFVHTRAYWRNDRGSWDERTHSFTPEQMQAWLDEQFSRYAPVVFMSEQPKERLRRAVVFGSTLISQRAEDELDSQYWAQYQRFFAGAGAVLFRDAVSAARISPLRGAESTQGCDCAFLLTHEDTLALTGFSPSAERSGAGVFFGRTPQRAEMLSFATALSRVSGEPLRWFPWFASRRRQRIQARWHGVRVPAGEYTPGVLLSQLSGFRFVLTDTYHVCVNAWRMGIPAVCIGQGSGNAASSLGDKKKEVLYEMLGARSLYLFAENLQSGGIYEQEATRVASVLENTDLLRRVMLNATAQRDAAQLRLKTALDAALAL